MLKHKVSLAIMAVVLAALASGAHAARIMIDSLTTPPALGTIMSMEPVL